jgi:Zn-finger nucleic acid-binding protein
MLRGTRLVHEVATAERLAHAIPFPTTPRVRVGEVGMNCPRCTTTVLSELDRDGITVDVCPGCRGVWLDRGELERMRSRWLQELEREFGAVDPRRAAPPPVPQRDEGLPASAPAWRRRDDDDDDDDRRDRDRLERDRLESGTDRERVDRDRYERDGHAPRKRRWFEMFDLFD